jgi:mannosyltransferase
MLNRIKTKKENLALIGILLLGIVLRLLWIDRRGIWYDDAFSILLAKQPIAQIISGTAADTMPPLYYLLLHFWMMISREIAWLRGLNLILFLALQGVMYFWVRRIASKRAALLAIFFASIAPFLIYHTQEIRMYMLLVLCQTAYLFFFTHWIKEDTQRKITKSGIGMLLCGSAAFYSHNLAIFGLVIPAVYLLMRRDFRRLLHWAGYFVGMIILFVPWLIFVPGQIDKIQTAFWTTRPGLIEVIQSVYGLLSFLPQANLWMLISGVLCFQFLFLLVWESLKQRRNIPYFGLFILGIGFIPIVLFIVSYFMRPVYVARGFILSAVVIYCLAAILIGLNWYTGFSKIMIGLLVLISVISMVFYYPYNAFPRSPFAEACSYLDKQTSGGTNGLVLHDNKLSSFPCLVYQPGLRQEFLGDEPGTHNDTFAYASQVAMQLFPVQSMDEAITGQAEIYYVVFTRALQEYAGLDQGEYPALDTLSQEFDEEDVRYFNDLAVYHYVKTTD